MRLMICTLALALAAPTLVQAGPAGSGLAHTESVARKHAAAKAAAQPLHVKASATCLPQAEAALAAEPGVKSVARSGETFVVHVHSTGTTAPELQRVVDSACGTNTSAS